MKTTCTTVSIDESHRLANTLAQHLGKGSVVELIGDVGAGKTEFVRGIVAAYDPSHIVQSPTFTLKRTYSTDKINIHHYDLYRLGKGSGIMSDEIVETMDDDHAITCIEWGHSVSGVLPEDRLQVEIVPLGENKREFTFTTIGNFKYKGKFSCI